MKYSVIIPMYNSEETIATTINSVFKQSRFDLIEEILVIDDGSTDRSCDIVGNIPDEKGIINLIKKENGGAASARNLGIKMAKSNMIALLDSDDEWLPEKMEIQDRYLSSYPNIKALGSNRIGECISLGKAYKDGINKISSTLYCLKCWPCTPSLVFDKTLFEDNRYFPEDMTHAEEGLFFLKLSYNSGLYYCREALVKCGGGKRAFGSAGLSGNIKKMHKGVCKMIIRASKKDYISKLLVPLLLLFEEAKYIRRIMFVAIDKRK